MRTVYYVVSCTSEENQNGIFKYSQPFEKEINARDYAERCRKYLGNDGHVAIESHKEIFENNEWRIDPEIEAIHHIEYF